MNIGPSLDEVINRSVYGAQVEAHVTQRLEDERLVICDGYGDWGPAVERKRVAVRATVLGDNGKLAPPRPADAELMTLCRERPFPEGPRVVAPATAGIPGQAVQ